MNSYSIPQLQRIYNELPAGAKFPVQNEGERVLLKRALQRNIFAEMTEGERVAVQVFIEYIERMQEEKTECKKIRRKPKRKK